MIYTPKKILNVFGAPGGVYAAGARQISPVACYAMTSTCLRSGAWVFRNNNNNTNNCANNCASNCASNFRSSVGFRRALFASPIPDTKMKVLPNSAGLCNQKYGRYQGAKATELVSMHHALGQATRVFAVGRVNLTVPRANE